jgi:uncharacterized protein (DUF1501 family)
MSITRRKFISGGLQIFAASFAGPELLNILAQAASAAPRQPGSKILILVQLAGGNDGINTVIPYADPAYAKLRPTLAIKPHDVLALDAQVGLHPSMTAMADLYRKGQVAILQAVGYPEPNRSHFRSIEIWQTAEPKKVKDTGWIGRYLDLASSDRKDSADNIFPAINVDPILPKTLSAQKIVVPSVNNIADFRFKADPRYENDRRAQIDAFNDIYSNFELKRRYSANLRKVGLDTTQASDFLAKIVQNYKPAIEYPKEAFGKQMQFIAQLITGGVNCGVYNVTLGGFDTHTNQARSQEGLLKQLSNGISALQADLALHGLDKDVLVMTFSEFGRRVAENGGRGTDHGTAEPMFIVGSSVRGGLFGNVPNLSDLQDGDLKYQIDFRNVYATILEKWLGADSKQVLGDRFDQLDLIQAV